MHLINVVLPEPGNPRAIQPYIGVTTSMPIEAHVCIDKGTEISGVEKDKFIYESATFKVKSTDLSIDYCMKDGDKKLILVAGKRALETAFQIL